jgi:hypothetical protein
MTRTLVHIPILHTDEDLGDAAQSVRDATARAGGAAALSRRQAILASLWSRIETWVRECPIPPSGLLVFQDGLPVCDAAPASGEAPELAIVRELARKGSRNHAMLLDLHQRGATITGTESPQLLLEELALLRKAQQGQRDPRHEFRSRAILEKRDRFIADRIAATLAPGGSALLLLGMLHNAVGMLPADITVTQPIDTRAALNGAA